MLIQEIEVKFVKILFVLVKGMLSDVPCLESELLPVATGNRGLPSGERAEPADRE